MSMPARKLTSEQRLSRAIDVMEALYASGSAGLTRNEICSRFDISGTSLDEILDIVSTLADRESGARIICERNGEHVSLTGDAGRVLPLRLSAAEGAVLNHELESLGIEFQAAARIRHALLPEELGYNQRIVDTVVHGSHWQQLSCAIRDGVRCRITYRSMDDQLPRERLIDPLRITTNGDQTYLNAWDVEIDERRSYRMDKIEGLVLTDDSVVHRASNSASLHDSLAQAKQSTKLLMPLDMAERLDWAGIMSIEPNGAGAATVIVHYSSERWLLSQVIAAGGAIRILDDPALSKRLCDMAKTLACPL